MEDTLPAQGGKKIVSLPEKGIWGQEIHTKLVKPTFIFLLKPTLVFLVTSLPFITPEVFVSCSIVSNSLWAPWAVAHQVPLSMGIPRPEYWKGLLLHSPVDLPNPVLNLGLLHCRQTLLSEPLLPLLVVMPSHFSCVWLFENLWTIAHQAPLSVGFSR